MERGWQKNREGDETEPIFSLSLSLSLSLPLSVSVPASAPLSLYHGDTRSPLWYTSCATSRRIWIPPSGAAPPPSSGRDPGRASIDVNVPCRRPSISSRPGG